LDNATYYRIAAVGQPRGSIDETIAMIDSISQQHQLGEDRFNTILFRDLVFPPLNDDADYQGRKYVYDTFFRQLADYANVRHGHVIGVAYSIIHKSGQGEYILIGASPFLPGDNPQYSFTYYLDGEKGGVPDGKPDAMLEYKGAYEGSANYNVTNGRDPAKAMNFAPIPSQAWVGANHDFENLLGYVRKLFKKTTERHAPRVNRKK